MLRTWIIEDSSEKNMRVRVTMAWGTLHGKVGGEGCLAVPPSTGVRVVGLAEVGLGAWRKNMGENNRLS